MPASSVTANKLQSFPAFPLYSTAHEQMVRFAILLLMCKVFLTWRAIYILTFDLSKDLDEKVESSLSSSLKKVIMQICSMSTSISAF